MTAELLMRRAKPEDAQRIAALARWVWLDRYVIDDGVNADVADYLRQEFDEQLLRQAMDLGRSWVIERGSTLLAWAQLDETALCPVELGAPSVELKRLYVSPRSQGQGLGARLLRQCRQEWPEQALWLSSWVGNVDALRFYRREGAAYWGETWFELGGERHRNEVLGWPALEQA
ncbi:GNAT superfamily N-acetyltransferase [Paucibacter oligotrophus]|uniref:GNAT superfamily N-acetyltransferase n=1 Tax=Roseateles oligotrophus TaxID=1769250 RepID=A0A840L826_9BURK|nr:GNAT family N-acetyltransferase [Roseateles oligotrophus]MBB4842378.1 GNAT superfamily N-acetyltransferase [Roseateles oligotrophus]